MCVRVFQCTRNSTLKEEASRERENDASEKWIKINVGGDAAGPGNEGSETVLDTVVASLETRFFLLLVLRGRPATENLEQD